MSRLRPLPVLLALSLALPGCDPCGNEVSQTVVSPSGRLKAVVFNRNCGATTGFNTQVSILPAAAALPDDGGNTLILGGAVPLKVEWRSDATLRLNGVGAARLYKQEHAVAGVSIRYGD
jgi:hypothetical protein